MKAAWKSFLKETREAFMIETMKEMGRNYKYNGMGWEGARNKPRKNVK